MKKYLIGFLFMTLMIFPNKIEAKVSNKESEEFANIVFFAYFSGTQQEMDADIKYFQDNSQNLINIYEGDYKRSFTNYLKEISYGKFNVRNIFPQLKNGVIEPIKLNTDIASCYKRNNDTELINQIVSAYPSIGNKIVDYDGDGFIDNITIIIKDREGYEANEQSTFISHKSFYPGVKDYLNKKIGTYNIVSTLSIKNNQSGVLAHEFLHSLGYPDLYRSENGDDYPVYTWDIMASANYGMSYPLAFLRSEITNWIDIDMVTESRSLKLDLQSNASGNQAYILKSPLNDYEYFVVEFRKKDTSVNDNILDRFIGGSGIIVYRVDTTVEGFSNNHGKTGIYVFRPQNFSDERTRVYNAYLSLESGRTSIGTSDMSKGISDGALTFSDGTNSGIVIKNVSSANGDYMTFDVEIPRAENFDLWKNTNINDLIGDSYKEISITNYNNQIYALSYGNNKICMQQLQNNSWITVGTCLNDNFLKAKTVEFNGELYLVANTFHDIKIYKLINNTFANVATYTDTKYINEIDANVINGKMYIVSSGTEVISDTISTGYANMYVLNGSTLQDLGVYYNANYNNCPKVVNIGNDVYVSIRTMNGDVLLYKYDGTFRQISTNINTNTYDLITLNNNLYFAVGTYNGSKLKLVKYDGTSFTEIISPIIMYFPQMVVSQGNLYILGTNNNNLYTFSYDETQSTFNIEGTVVDIGDQAYNTSLVSKGSTIYVGIGRTTSKQLLVKAKEITNKLLSISINKPNKTIYKVGENLDKTGLIVRANYVNGTVNVNNYTITDFDTSKAGKYKAVIIYEGYSQSFEYEVKDSKVEESKPNNPTQEEKPNNPIQEEKPIINSQTLYEMIINKGYKIKSEFAFGFSLNTTIDAIKTKFNNLVNVKSSSNIIGTGSELTYNNEKYTIVLYGDLNGDGKINSADLLKMRQHLLGTSVLSGAYKEAAYVTNSINSASLLKLRQHLLGTSMIVQ